jgi:DNA-binding protein HU-beta
VRRYRGCAIEREEKHASATQKKSIAGTKPGRAGMPGTVTLKQIAGELAVQQDLSKKRAEAMLADLAALTTPHLKKGERLRLTGLGILQVRHRAARMGPNPATGEAIRSRPARKSPSDPPRS